MVQNYVLHWYFSDSNISYLTEYLMSKIKRNFERNLKEVVVAQIGLMILNDDTLSIISFISPKREIQMFDINRFEYRISLFA